MHYQSLCELFKEYKDLLKIDYSELDEFDDDSIRYNFIPVEIKTFDDEEEEEED